MIKKIIILSSLIFNSFAFAKVNVIVSILPELTFVNAIGGNKINTSLMVKLGSEPHSYEPKPSQMKDITKANLYFSIGVEFEEIWLKNFANLNKNMKIIDLTKHITKFPIIGDFHNIEVHKNENKEHNSLDPHIWTNPKNVKIIVKDIYESLVNIDNKNKDYYKNNYNKFIAKINNTDTKIREILADVKVGTKFMVFHPAWGYFAKEYGLKQLAIEAGGKNPKPKQIIYLIKEAKKQKVKAIFAEPEFSTKIANQIAKEVGVKVLKISPLNSNWSDNLINLANAIKNK